MAKSGERYVFRLTPLRPLYVLRQMDARYIKLCGAWRCCALIITPSIGICIPLRRTWSLVTASAVWPLLRYQKIAERGLISWVRARVQVENASERVKNAS